MLFKHSVIYVCAAIVFAAACEALGQFEIDWHTVDGGGVTNSTDGQPDGFELSGTIGQHDAQLPPVMSGGTFELTGGFWAISPICNCPGDMNGDGLRDGRDIQQFTICMTADGSCACADMDGDNGVNTSDVAVFVTDLLAETTCP